MNREIKFRVFDKNYQKFLPFVDNIRIKDLNNQDDFISQQFTGLKDSKGKEIYEGDILEYFGNDGDSEDKPSHVVYDEKSASFITEHYCLTYHLAKEHLEVIGNIFENPELLK